jgi:hypothetical protein
LQLLEVPLRRFYEEETHSFHDINQILIENENFIAASILSLNEERRTSFKSFIHTGHQWLTHVNLL